MLKRPEQYNRKVREMVEKYAKPDMEIDSVSDISRDDLSELSETSDLDMELLMP